MQNTPLNALEAINQKVKLGQNFLLAGSDAFLIDRVIGNIRNQLKQHDDVDLSIVYADEVKNKAGELAEHLDTFTIFSSNKLIVLKNAEQLNKKELEVLADYCQSPAESQSLVLTVEKFDARLAAWKKISAACVRINCDPPRWGGEIRAWLISELKRIGKNMSPKGIEEFSSRVELDYYSAANCLDKILLLVNDRKSINEADVLASLGTTRTGTLIDFYRALGKRNNKATIEAVEKMLNADWEPLQVFFQLYRFFLILYRVQLLRKKHLSDSEISNKHLGEIFTSQRKEYLDFAAAYSISALESIISILLDTDSKLKSSSIDKNMQLVLAIISILEAK